VQPDTQHETIVTTFLSSSFYAEDEATPVVDKLLRHAWSDEERAVLLAYAREEALHARLITAYFERRKQPLGQPFWIQRVFRIARSRLALLVQFYHVEILAGSFYGAMAARAREPEARALIKQLLLDESRHIRLHRELLAREIARQGFVGRCKARALAFLYRAGWALTARYQARQLAPVLGDLGPRVAPKLARRLRADLPILFGDSPPVPTWFLEPRAAPRLAGAGRS
jgi:rubrerythrin